MNFIDIVNTMSLTIPRFLEYKILLNVNMFSKEVSLINYKSFFHLFYQKYISINVKLKQHIGFIMEINNFIYNSPGTVSLTSHQSQHVVLFAFCVLVCWIPFLISIDLHEYVIFSICRKIFFKFENNYVKLQCVFLQYVQVNEGVNTTQRNIVDLINKAIRSINTIFSNRSCETWKENILNNRQTYLHLNKMTF